MNLTLYHLSRLAVVKTPPIPYPKLNGGVGMCQNCGKTRKHIKNERTIRVQAPHAPLPLFFSNRSYNGERDRSWDYCGETSIDLCSQG